MFEKFRWQCEELGRWWLQQQRLWQNLWQNLWQTWCRVAEWRSLRGVAALLLAIALLVGTSGCSDRIEPTPTPNGQRVSQKPKVVQLSEVSPPPALQELDRLLDVYQPQVAILSPNPNETLQDTGVEVKLQVKDLPVFRSESLGTGPHLHLILDNQPSRSVFDLSTPVLLEGLTPGTHTLRVFAVKPWNESFKNEGAYAQIAFHVFAPNQENRPNPDLPLLTYNSPEGIQGAEPILLDYYLTNAPLHLVAQADAEDEIQDWRVRVTVNGESFVSDRWEPIYLTGFQPGQNWVKLEFLDDRGNLLQNAFNDPVRLVTYDPEAQDALSLLVKGKLSAQEARGIVDPGTTVPTAIEPEQPAEAQPEVPQAEVTGEEVTGEEVTGEEVTGEEVAPSEEATGEAEASTEAAQPEAPPSEVFQPEEAQPEEFGKPQEVEASQSEEFGESQEFQEAPPEEFAPEAGQSEEFGESQEETQSEEFGESQGFGEVQPEELPEAFQPEGFSESQEFGEAQPEEGQSEEFGESQEFEGSQEEFQSEEGQGEEFQGEVPPAEEGSPEEFTPENF